MLTYLGKNPIYIVLGLFLFVYLFLSLTLHYQFNTTDADLAIYAQHVWYLSQGDIFGYGNTFKAFNIFGDHFIVHFFWISLLYKIWSSASVLIIVQTTAVVLSALPLYWFAKERLKDTLSALLLVSGYLLFYGFQSAAIFPFHGATLSSVFISFTLWFAYKRKWLPYFIFLVAALFSKEDVPTFTFAFGLYLFFMRKDRKIGLITAAVSLVYFYLVIYQIMPFFLHGQPYTYLVESPNSKFLNPIGLIKDFFIPIEKTKTLTSLFSSFGLLPLLSLSYLFIVAPFLLARFTSPVTQRWAPWMHYSANQGPILGFGEVLGLENLVKLAEKIKIAKRFVANKIYFYRFYLSLTILVSILIGVYYQMPLYKLLTPNFYQTSAGVVTINQALALIPSDPNISVATQSGLLPHLALRKKIYMYPHPSFAVNEPRGDLQDSDPIQDYAVPDVDYIILSKNAFHWRPASGKFDEVLTYVKSLPGYEVVFDKDATVVLKRK